MNAPLDALMCPLQIINNSEPLSLTLHSVNACFICHPSNVENYLIGHKSETDQPEPKKKKKIILDNIFLHPSTNPLQIINNSEPLSLTLHSVNACFICHPSNVENYLIGHKSETDQPEPKKKKKLFWTTYFYTLLQILYKSSITVNPYH